MIKNLRVLGNFLAYSVYMMGLGFVAGRIYQGIKQKVEEKAKEIKVDA